jgi:hypothetical protein
MSRPRNLFLVSVLPVLVLLQSERASLAATHAAPVASAQAAKAGAASAAPEEKVAPDSPRAAYTDFRHLTRRGDYAGA